MTKAEKEDLERDEEIATSALKSDDVVKTEADAKYQEFIMRKLGKLSHSTSQDQFTVDHEVQVCGQMVKVPIFEMDVDGQSNIITPQLLDILQKTPAERRAMAAQPGKLQHWKAYKIVDKAFKRGRGNRLKLALKPFSEDLLEQLHKKLMKETRKEVFQKIKFSTGGKKTRKAAKKINKAGRKKIAAKFAAKAKATVENINELTAKAKDIRTTSKFNGCIIIYSIPSSYIV